MVDDAPSVSIQRPDERKSCLDCESIVARVELYIHHTGEYEGCFEQFFKVRTDHGDFRFHGQELCEVLTHRFRVLNELTGQSRMEGRLTVVEFNDLVDIVAVYASNPTLAKFKKVLVHSSIRSNESVSINRVFS